MGVGAACQPPSPRVVGWFGQGDGSTAAAVAISRRRVCWQAGMPGTLCTLQRTVQQGAACTGSGRAALGDCNTCCCAAVQTGR